jgi:replication initiation and membrane attachment protein DnaB
MSLANKLQYQKDEVDFVKSIFKLNMLVDLISKELNNNYSAINVNYKEQLKGITKSFEKFKIQTNSTSSWSYNTLNSNQQIAIFELSEQVEKIIDTAINEVYD